MAAFTTRWLLTTPAPGQWINIKECPPTARQSGTSRKWSRTRDCSRTGLPACPNLIESSLHAGQYPLRLAPHVGLSRDRSPDYQVIGAGRNGFPRRHATLLIVLRGVVLANARSYDQ